MLLFSSTSRRHGSLHATHAVAILFFTAACIEPSPDPAPEEASPASFPPSPASTGSLSAPSALAPGEHEPIVTVFTQVFRAFAPRYFDITGLDREISVDLAWWVNGTPYPSLFRFTGTFPNGSSYSTELTDHPILELPHEPGQTSVRISFEHQSQAPEFRGKVILREPVHADQLGGCGDDIRDRFVGWVRSQRNWETNYQVQHVTETLPNKISTLTCGGLCYGTTYFLRGTITALPGSRGPILQIEELDHNPYMGTLPTSYLLFFDETGALLRRVDGKLYFVLPDGNLFISTGMADPGRWNNIEAVASVTPSGTTAWTRAIGGSPPGTVVTTAAGNLAMPWASWNQTTRGAGLFVFDPITGADVDETFLDRSPLCTMTSTDPACVELQADVRYDFELWWSQNWSSFGQWRDGPFRACDATTCSAASLTGWLPLGDEIVLELDVVKRAIDGHTESLKRLVFFGRDDSLQHASLGGAFYRQLTPDHILVSTTFGSWANAVTRERSGEGLVAVGNRAAIAWRRNLTGPPALLRSRSGSIGSAGYLLSGDRLFWATYSSWDGGSSTMSWIDLATGALLSVPANRILEGSCRPR
jgi:hypothetical protein